MRKNNLLYTAFMICLLAFLSCSSEVIPGDDQECSLYSMGEEGTFFSQGDYTFSCMSDEGSLAIEFPVLGTNYQVLAQGDDAVEYVVSATYAETADRAYSDFEFFIVFGDNASETKEPVANLGDEAYFYTIVNDNILRHYLVVVDCNFVSTIAGEYDSADPEPCNLGKDALVQFASEMHNNI